MSQIHRRAFLRTCTAAALLPATLQSSFGRAAASERIRLAFVGVRNQGTNNLKTFFKHKDAQIVALCDVDRAVLDKAKALVEKTAGGSVECTNDFRKLLDRKDIDAVVLTTPDHWHALPTVMACMAGKDVYCEKPLSLTVAEGQTMVAAARKYQRVVQTGSQQRSEYGGKFRTAAELVRNGKLGKLKVIKCGIPKVNFQGPAVPDSAPPAELDYEFWLGPAPFHAYNEKRVHYNFRFFWDYSGGQLTNFGAHHLDIAQWALGMDASGPIEISATSRYVADKSFEVPEFCEVTYTYANGVKVLCGQGYPGGCTFEGEKGSIFVDRNKIESKPGEILKQELGSSAVKLYQATSHAGNWLECIKSRKAPICEAAIGHRSATVCHLGNVAIRHGKPIRWDPNSEKILGDAAAAAYLTRAYRKPWELPALG